MWSLTLWLSRTRLMRLRSNVPLRNSCWVSCASTQTSERFDTHSSRLGLHCSLSLEPCNPVERIDSRVRDMRTEGGRGWPESCVRYSWTCPKVYTRDRVLEYKASKFSSLLTLMCLVDRTEAPVPSGHSSSAGWCYAFWSTRGRCPLVSYAGGTLTRPTALRTFCLRCSFVSCCS